jgi:hypothetical protein
LQAGALTAGPLAHRKVERKAGRMAKKLGIGDTFPKMTLNLVNGGTLELPDGMNAKYRIMLFYRGHW